MLERAALEIVGLFGAAAPLYAGSALCSWLGRLARGADAQSRTSSGGSASLPRRARRLGSPGHGVVGFCRSHREAMYARRVAQLTHRRPGSTTRYDDVALAALASADVEHAREFVATELGQLAAGDDHSRRLTATLRVYLEENMSPLRAAHRLGVHENTITNRIRAAQELIRTRSSIAPPSCRSRSDCSRWRRRPSQASIPRRPSATGGAPRARSGDFCSSLRPVARRSPRGSGFGCHSAIAPGGYLSMALRQQAEHGGDLPTVLVHDGSVRRFRDPLVSQQIAERGGVSPNGSSSEAVARPHRATSARSSRATGCARRWRHPLRAPGRAARSSSARRTAASWWFPWTVFGSRWSRRSRRASSAESTTRRKSKTSAHVGDRTARLPNQTNSPLLDQVSERNTAGLIRPSNRLYQPQIALVHRLLGRQVSALDPLGEPDLLGGVQKRSVDADGGAVHATAASERDDTGRRERSAAKPTKPVSAGDGVPSRHSSSKASSRLGASGRAMTPAGRASGPVVRATTSFPMTAVRDAGSGGLGAKRRPSGQILQQVGDRPVKRGTVAVARHRDRLTVEILGSDRADAC